MREGNDGEAVVRLQLLDGRHRGVLNAFQSADARAVFFVHGTAHVEHQGQIQAQWLARAVAAGD